MNKFNRSSFMKSRHQLAKKQREFYEDFYEDRGLPKPQTKYSEFLRKENNPVYDIVKVYDVSYQATYSSGKEGFSINTQTFKVYVLETNRETEMYIESATRDTYRNLLGGDKKELNAGLKSVLDDGLYTTVKGLDNPRGLEEAEEKDLTFADIEKLKTNRTLVKELDTNIKIQNKKGKKFDGYVSDIYFRK